MVEAQAQAEADGDERARSRDLMHANVRNMH